MDLNAAHSFVRVLFKRASSSIDDEIDLSQDDWETTFEPLPGKDMVSWQVPKPGRNDPYPCGSGKKYENVVDPMQILKNFHLARELHFATYATN